MSGYNQNCIISPAPAVTSVSADHSGPYTIKPSEAFQGALVVISGLSTETIAVQTSPDGTVWGAVSGQTALGNGAFIVDLRGAVAYKFVKSAGANTATISHSTFRYS